MDYPHDMVHYRTQYARTALEKYPAVYLKDEARRVARELSDVEARTAEARTLAQVAKIHKERLERKMYTLLERHARLVQALERKAKRSPQDVSSRDVRLFQ